MNQLQLDQGVKQLQELEKALEQIKPEHKSCLELFYLKDMCYQEVSDKTGYTLKQVKSYIQNGKRNLKNILSDNSAFVAD